MTSPGPGGGWGPGEGWGGGGWGAPGGGPHDAGGGRPPIDPIGPPHGSPLRLTPLSITALLEVAARIIRRHAAPLLAVSALFQLPSSLLDALAQQGLARALAPIVVGFDTDAPRILEPTPAQSDAILLALLVVVVSTVIGTLAGAIATLAFTSAALDDYEGRRPTVRSMVMLALGRALPALVAGLLAALVLIAIVVGAVVLATTALAALPPAPGGGGGLGAFLAILVGVSAVVLSVVVMVRLGFPAAVLAAERVGPIEALRRSWHLTGDNTWRAFAVLAIVTIVITILGSTLLGLLAVVITDGIAAPLGFADLSDALLSGLVTTLLAPVGGVVLAVLYLDLRVRRDGWQPLATPPLASAEDGPVGDAR